MNQAQIIAGPFSKEELVFSHFATFPSYYSYQKDFAVAIEVRSRLACQVLTCTPEKHVEMAMTWVVAEVDLNRKSLTSFDGGG